MGKRTAWLRSFGICLTLKRVRIILIGHHFMLLKISYNTANVSFLSLGGHTIFPRFNGAPQPRVFNDCTKGLVSIHSIVCCFLPSNDNLMVYSYFCL